MGVPVALWGLAAIAFSIVWVFVWPSDKVDGLGGSQYLVLRWGHALVWLLLALSAFAASTPATARLSQPLAFMALGVYGAFLFAVVRAG